MKKLLLILLMMTTVAQAETYKWIDKQGTVNFSDSIGNVPSAYRDSAKSGGPDSSTTSNSIRTVSSAEPGLHGINDGSLAPQVADMKDRMLHDEGVMALIGAMQNDPEMQALLGDPAVIGAIQAMDIGTLLNNPAFMKLLNNPRVQEIEKRMQQSGTK